MFVLTGTALAEVDVVNGNVTLVAVSFSSDELEPQELAHTDVDSSLQPVRAHVPASFLPDLLSDTVPVQLEQLNGNTCYLPRYASDHIFCNTKRTFVIIFNLEDLIRTKRKVKYIVEIVPIKTSGRWPCPDLKRSDVGAGHVVPEGEEASAGGPLYRG